MTSEGSAVEIKDSVFDPDVPDERVIRVRDTRSDRPLYRVFLYLEGVGLPFVRSVNYELHQTFSPSTRRVVRSVTNPRCKLTIWTWGIFTVKATIEGKAGRREIRTHQLTYDKQFNEEGVRFVRE